MRHGFQAAERREIKRSFVGAQPVANRSRLHVRDKQKDDFMDCASWRIVKT
jgi:hypothetical protein